MTIWYLECGFLSVYAILDKLNFLNLWAGLFHGFRKILDQDLSIAFALRLTSIFLGLQLHACWASELSPIGLLSSFNPFFFFLRSLSLAVLHLRGCAQACSSCRDGGLLRVVVCGLLIAGASLVAKPGLEARELSS